MRIEKRGIQNIGGMEMHNERKTDNHSNEDINKELTHLNYNLIECKNYKKSIQKELDERYKSDRKIRVDAVLAVEVLFTSDNEFFKSLNTKQEKLYFEKSLEFLKDFVGEKNVISATVHRDEKTPHLHAVFTPITADGRLHFKSFINGKNDMIKLQDNYYKYISKYFPELERGKSADKTQRKHLNVAEYKEVSNLESELKEKKAELVQIDKKVEDKKTELQIAKNNLQNEKNEVEELRKKITSEKKFLLKLENVVSEIRSQKNLLSKDFKISEEQLNFLINLSKKTEQYSQKYTEVATAYNNILADKRILKKSNDELKNSKNDFEEQNLKLNYYVSKLEKILPKEKIEKIKKESESELFSLSKIKELVTNTHVDDYLKELYVKGLDNLNFIEKNYVDEKADSKNEIALRILGNEKEDNLEKNEVDNSNHWESKSSSDNPWEIGR